MFIQLHTLTSYPGTLLNRDDAGFAKRLPFGGTVRTRVSSQCLKHNWRRFDGEHSLFGIDADEVTRSIRSRETFKRCIAHPLIERGYPARLVVPFAKALQEIVISDNTLKKSEAEKLISPADPDELLDELKTGQVTILGKPEVDYISEVIVEELDALRGEFEDLWPNPGGELSKDQVDTIFGAIKDLNKGDLSKNLKGLRLSSGLDAAMFGRMITSDILSRGDGAVHVAHAITTHEEESESDYFTAVDELLMYGSGEKGSGHLNSQELTSGLYYGYVVIDVPLLVSNLTGEDRKSWPEADYSLASEIIRRMVNLVATTSPGAKLGSTAPYSYASFVMAEIGKVQPRTLSNAFQKAVRTDGDGVLSNTYSALMKYVTDMDQMYGVQTKRRVAAVGAPDDFYSALSAEQANLTDLARWASAKIEVKA